MHVAWKICILGAISLNKIFIKICSHPIISWFFYDPLFLMKTFCDPQLFHDPPYSEENDSPLRDVFPQKSKSLLGYVLKTFYHACVQH